MRRSRWKQVDKRHRKFQFISITVIAGVVAAITYGVYSYVQNLPRTAFFGAVGSTHEHTAIGLFINGQMVDFSLPQYLGKSQYTHFEGGDGIEKQTAHKHATGVDIGFLFESMDIKFNEECLIMDNGESYCNDGTNLLKFFVNGVRNSNYNSYVLNDNDKVLISYGSDDQQQVEEQLEMLDLQVMNK